MRHPFPQNPAPSANPSSTRRLRIALGTWVAIEARVGSRRAAGPSALDAGATSWSGSPGSTRKMAPSEPPLSSRMLAPDEPAFPLTAASENEAREASEHAAIEAAYAAIRDIDIRMHPCREGSEIALINSAEPGTPIELQRDTWRLLQLARRLHDLTDGIFDPCLPTRPGRLRDIEIQPNTPTLICHAPVELDLGGIAKGYAIDRAVEKLQESGCTSGLVNAGGDLRVFGERTETIFLRRQVSEPGFRSSDGRDYPGSSNDSDGGDTQGVRNLAFHSLPLQNSALAVSDLDADNRPSEHQGYYIRGRDNNLATPRYAAVIASTTAMADALTKCVLLCPAELGVRVLHELGGRVVKP